MNWAWIAIVVAMILVIVLAIVFIVLQIMIYRKERQQQLRTCQKLKELEFVLEVLKMRMDSTPQLLELAADRFSESREEARAYGIHYQTGKLTFADRKRLSEKFTIKYIREIMV